MNAREIRIMSNKLHEALTQDFAAGTEMLPIIAGLLKSLVQINCEIAAQLAERNEHDRCTSREEAA